MPSPRCSLLTTLLTWLALSFAGVTCGHAAGSLSTDTIINLPSAATWDLFTTEAGLKSMGYGQARVEVRLGGALQASGGVTTLPSLDDQIISLDSGHMLSFKPADSSHAEWTVLYFTAMGEDMTQLRWLQFFADSQTASASQRQQQIRQLFDQLIRRYAPECAVCKLETAADK